MRGLALALLLTSLALAGCAGGGDDDGGADVGNENPADVKVDPKSELGAVSGVIVDDAIVPVDGAHVVLQAADVLLNTTTKEGVFAFEHLDPGVYFISANRTGYAGPATTVEVKAGEVTYARLMLLRIAGTDGYHYTVEKTGFIQASPAAGGAIVDAAVDAFSFLVGDNPTCKNCIFTVENGAQDVKTFVVEGTWANTLPPATADDLTLFIINSNTTTQQPGYGAAIFSPYLAHFQTADDVFNEGEQSTWWRFQVSGSLTQPNVNQQFHLFVTVFVDQPAPEGWALANGDV